MPSICAWASPFNLVHSNHKEYILTIKIMNSITVLSVNCFHRWAICSARWHAGHFRRTLWWPSDLQPHHDSAERGRIPDRHTWICFQTYSVPLGVSERGSRQSIWQRDLHLSDISCTWPRALRSQQQTSFYSKNKNKKSVFSSHFEMKMLLLLKASMKKAGKKGYF